MSYRSPVWSAIVALALLSAAGCKTASDCGESIPLGSFEEMAFFATPEVRQDEPRRVTVEPIPGELRRAFEDARPGDLIELQPGTHSVGSGSLSLASSGTPDRWIRVAGAGQVRPVIDLRGQTEFRISGSYVLLENVEIRNGKGNNLHLAPGDRNSEMIIVRDCTIAELAKGAGAAIKLNRNNPKGSGLAHVYIEDCDLSGARKNAVIDGVGVSQIVVRRNFIHDNDEGSSGIFLKGGSSDVLIEGNVITGIRGNSAVKLGGSTGEQFFHPAHPDQEGVNQIARNNIVTDCDDSVFEIRGTVSGRIYHNTIVSQTGFAIFRFQAGRNADGGYSQNDDIEIVNNLIFATEGDPQFARNDAGPGEFTFRSNLWIGDLHNPGSAGSGIPRFPCTSDLTVSEEEVVNVLRQPTLDRLLGLEDAMARYAPASGSPAVGAGAPTAVAREDASGHPRSSSGPTIGALEAR